MANYKRGKPRKQVRCTLCTDGRENRGGPRQQEKRAAFAPDTPPVTNGGDESDWCPDCNGTGRCPDHPDCHNDYCVDGVCPLCMGAKTY
jgi:hypothetical protein